MERIVRHGGPGEILIRSACMTVGLWNNESGTREILRDGWLHTGDLGEIDSNGNLTFIDRIKDIIISGGLNISAAEVGARDLGCAWRAWKLPSSSPPIPASAKHRSPSCMAMRPAPPSSNIAIVTWPTTRSLVTSRSSKSRCRVCRPAKSPSPCFDRSTKEDMVAEEFGDSDNAGYRPGVPG